MAFTSSKMGLRIWNLLTDLYDHTQLADNLAKIDYHDHSPGKGVQIPTEGLADGAVTGAKLATALDPTGAYTAVKIIARAGGTQSAAAAAGTYVIGPAFTLSVLPIAAPSASIYLDPAAWTASGRTVQYTLRASVFVNAVAPTATYAVSLFPVATWGGASGSAPTIATIGAAVAGSTLTFATPAASGPVTDYIEFAAPAVGYYALAVVQTGAGVANSVVGFSAALGAKSI